MKYLAEITAFLLVLCACASTPPEVKRTYTAESVVAWNEQVLAIAEAEDGFLTLKGLRTATLMHVAMHDALSSINGRFSTYAYYNPHPEADPLAAATQAAFFVAVAQYPEQRAALEAQRRKWLSQVPDDATRAAAIELGTAAAQATMRQRENDGWNNEAEYQWHPMAPGVYAEFREHSGTPDGFVFGAGWATARPFALESQDQFRSPPPPSIQSADYTRAYDEVREVGRLNSASRTADQTHLALWWKDFAENSHNRLARDLAVKQRLELADATRLFALLNISIFDAYVNVFDNKFYYNHWRPYTAIRWADNDGNPDTKSEPNWTNTHNHTYAFPSYPSAHGTACAAAMTALADTLGDEFAFTMRIPTVDIAGPFSGKMEMTPPGRQFQRFSDAAMECSMSRLYLGIHFRYDSIEGNQLGKKIGAYVLKTQLKRITGQN